MANNIIFDAGRIMNAAIALTPNNKLRFDHFGGFSAAMSTSTAEIRRATDPVRAAGEGRLFTTPYQGSINPTVKVNYKPAKDTSGIRTSRSSQGAGSPVTDGASTTIVYNQHIEKDFLYDVFTTIAKEPATIAYVNQILAGTINPSDDMGRMNLLSDVGLEFFRELNYIIPTINNAALASMLASVGKNAAFPTAVLPSAAAPFPKITLYNADKSRDLDEFRTAMRMTQLLNKFEGTPIIVGGIQLAKYMDKFGVLAVNQEGYVYGSAFSQIGAEWYFDTAADTVFGANKIIVFDSGAFCMNTFPDHDPVIGIVNGKRQHDNMYFSSFDVAVPQANSPAISSAANQSDILMTWDLRLKEVITSQDLPSTVVTPSLHYGFYKRPVGYFTAKVADIMNGVTGVFGFELLEVPAV